MDLFTPVPYNPDALADVITYISQLSLDGIDSLQSRAQDKDAVLTDEELAMAIFAEEAEGLLNIAKDRVSNVRGRSIYEELEEIESAARYDRLVALAISEGRPIPPRPTSFPSGNASLLEDDDDESSIASSSSSSSSSSTVEEVDFGIPSPTRALSPLVAEEPVEESSTEEIERIDLETETETLIEQCVICGDDVGEGYYRAPCGDVFDINCLEAMFRKAAIDESLFPPRCCQTPIPVFAARMRVSKELMDTYDKKAREFSVPNRVYCSQPRCSAFIGASTAEASYLECPECSKATCGYCKAAAHPGTECSDTDDLNSMAKDMHEKEGWQRCYSCHHMVELTLGCYHIICPCKAQFCYLCGAKWKECSCPQFAVPPGLD